MNLLYFLFTLTVDFHFDLLLQVQPYLLFIPGAFQSSVTRSDPGGHPILCPYSEHNHSVFFQPR